MAQCLSYWAHVIGSITKLLSWSEIIMFAWVLELLWGDGTRRLSALKGLKQTADQKGQYKGLKQTADQKGQYNWPFA